MLLAEIFTNQVFSDSCFFCNNICLFPFLFSIGLLLFTFLYLKQLFFIPANPYRLNSLFYWCKEQQFFFCMKISVIVASFFINSTGSIFLLVLLVVAFFYFCQIKILYEYNYPQSRKRRLQPHDGIN